MAITQALLRIARRFNPFRRIDFFGNATVYDYIYTVTKYINRDVLRIFGVFFAIEKLHLATVLRIDRYVNPVLYTAVIDNVVLLAVIVFVTSHMVRRVAKMAEFLSSGTWAPFYKETQTPEEIRLVYSTYTNVFADQEQNVPFNVVRSLIEHKLLKAFIVYKERLGSGERSVAGFFVVQYLSNTGADAVLRGEKDGRHFDSTDLVPDESTATALYVGALGGTGRMNRGFVIGQLYTYARTLPQLRMLGRPTTIDGQRLAKNNGWTPIKELEGKNDIWESRNLRVD